MMTLTRASVLLLARPLRRGLCDAHNIELRRGWRRATAAGAVCRLSDDEHINLKRERHPALSGAPLSPLLDESLVLVRYMYEGGVLSQGRLCKITPNSAQAVTGTELLATLAADGVDLERFAPCVYETTSSTGAWLPIGEDALMPLPDAAKDATDEYVPSRRIDVKLTVRQGGSSASAEARSALAEAEHPSGGAFPVNGYCGIGVVNTKNQANVGTLWRSAYQLGANFIFTIGTRYRHQPTDTIKAVQRMPLFEIDSWSDFAEKFSPRGAKWIAVEMGGTPLDEFEHPKDAVYLLGSEDAGLPKAVLRACHHTVSLRSENYASYNVAIAGSLVLYDRRQKEEARRKERRGK